jgi:hypothetical protein
MSMPGLTAETSLYKTSGHYRMGGTFDVLTGGVEILPQQRIAQLRGIGFCQASCGPNDFSCLFSCLGGGGIGNGIGSSDRRFIESCRCVRDSTSSTGRREHCRYTVPGIGSRIVMEDEC